MTITSDVRKYIEACGNQYFTKRQVAEKLWPKWRKSGLEVASDWKRFLAYVGGVVLVEESEGRIAQFGEPDCFTGAKAYKRVVAVQAAAKFSGDLTNVPTSAIVAELNRRFG